VAARLDSLVRSPEPGAGVGTVDAKRYEGGDTGGFTTDGTGKVGTPGTVTGFGQIPEDTRARFCTLGCLTGQITVGRNKRVAIVLSAGQYYTFDYVSVGRLGIQDNGTAATGWYDYTGP
jgi:hypothetical protein